MPIVVKDRVKETAAAPGTGTITLGGAVAGFQAFSAIGNGNVTYFAVVDSTSGAWEVNYGTYTASGTTLTRNATPLSSSNAGARVNFTGPVDVFCTYPSEKAIYEEVSGNVLIDGGPITVVGTGVTTYSTFSAALGELYGNINSFAQLYAQNLNDGSSASTDIVAYNDLGDGTNNFIDMGINSSNYTDAVYPIFTPGSGYVYNDGGELIIGSATDDVLFFAGGVATTDWAARIDKTSKLLTTKAGLTVGGALTGVGGAFTAPVTSTSSMTAPGATEFITRAYVDEATSNGFHVHIPVLVATTGNLTATYNQPGGAGVGVGATLTNSGTQVALSIDGVALATSDRVLVYQQTSGLQNGVYVVTTVGSGSTNWVLTRSSDANTSSEGDPGTLGGGDYFFVTSGTTQGFFAFICTNTSAIVFGTTAITFNEFSQVPIYIGTAPINVTGQTIALTGTVAATNGGTGQSTVTTGDLLYGSGTNTWSKLPKGAAYRSLIMDASATNVEWNAVPLNQANAVSGALGETNGGTGLNSYTLGDTVYSSAANTLAKLAGNTTTTKKFLTQTGTGAASAAPSWEVVNGADVTGNISGSAGSVANALTAGTYLTSGGTFDGSTARTFAVDATDANTASKVVARDASGNFSAGTITAALSGNATSATNVAGGAANRIVFNTGSGATAFAVAPSASGEVLGWNGSSLAWTTTIATATSATTATTATTANNVSGTVAVANGGTGSTSLTANNVLLGNGTSALQVVAPGTSGNVLASNGTTWVSQAAPASTSIAQLDTSVTVTDGVTSFTASVASSATTIQASQSGTTLTVTVVNGASPIVIGATISGINFMPNTVVTAFGTGTGGAGTYTVSTSLGRTSTTANLVYSTMTVTSVASGTLAVGQKITNAPSSAATLQTIPTNTAIIALGTGTGGVGTYILDKVFTLNSSTVFAGGSVATVVDGQNVEITAGGNMLIRTATQFNDSQGAFLSNRLIGSYATRTAGSGPAYYADLNGSGTITSADALDVLRIQQNLNQVSPRILSYACAYGTNGPNVGLGFSAFSLADISSISIGNNPSQILGAVNTVAVGHLTQVGSRITFNKYGADPLNSGNVRNNTTTYVAAEHQFLGGPVSLGGVTTITSAGTISTAMASTWTYVIFDAGSTATVTLQTQNAVINGRVDDGANTAAGTTLTVTSVTGQAIFVGMEIFMPGLDREYLTVTAFGTGTGGAGTYTVNLAARVTSTQMISSGPTAGRILSIKTIQNSAVNSASANVVPLAGGAAGTAILTTLAGRWATLVFNGTNWEIMAAN